MPNRKTQALAICGVFAVIYVLFAVYAMSCFFQNSALGDAYGRTRFDAMIDGKASRPFVFRQLVPIMVKAVDQVTPPSMRDSASQWVEDIKYAERFAAARQYMPWLAKTFPNPSLHYRRLVASVIITGFMIGYMAGMFALARVLFPREPAVALFAPLFAVLAFASFSYPWYYIYDVPCLFLSAACMYFLYRQRYRLYVLLFLMAALNKETAIYALIIFALWSFDRMEHRRFIGLFCLLGFIYLLVKVSLSINFMNNPGQFLEQNMQSVLAGDVLAQANMYKIGMIALLWFLCSYRWGDKPLFLKRALGALPFLYLGYFLYGVPHEYRVFFDMHPPLVLLAVHTLISGTGIAASPLFSNPYLLRSRENDAAA